MKNSKLTTKEMMKIRTQQTTTTTQPLTKQTTTTPTTKPLQKKIRLTFGHSQKHTWKDTKEIGRMTSDTTTLYNLYSEKGRPETKLLTKFINSYKITMGEIENNNWKTRGDKFINTMEGHGHKFSSEDKTLILNTLNSEKFLTHRELKKNNNNLDWWKFEFNHITNTIKDITD